MTGRAICGPQPSDRQTPCGSCGAPRVLGVRTCGRDCVRGLDPRLPDLLGVPPWAVSGRVDCDV